MNAKRICSIVIVLSIMLSLFPVQVLAENNTKPVFSVESMTAKAGDTIAVNVTIENNIGILGAELEISYDDGLTLTNAVNGEAFSYLSMTPPGKFTSSCKFAWDGLECNEENIKDGTVLTLTFQVSENVENGDKLNINISAPEGNIYDGNLSVIEVETVNGEVTIFDYIPGDVNGDQKVNTADVVLLRRFITGGYDAVINESAGNVNGDTRINVVDVISIRRFIVGGYGIQLLPSGQSDSHQHTMEKIEYKAPTCTEKGNETYWKCTSCGKYFNDENGTSQISDVSGKEIPALGHSPEIIPAVAPTETEPGWTEGSQCEVCGIVFINPEPIPILPRNSANITYKLVNASKDPYLAQQNIQNNENNRSTYIIGEGLTLSNDLTVPGYTFVGWFDSFDDNATQIKEISATSKNDVTLYAHWKENTYTITYNLYQTPVTSSPSTEQKKYTVSKGNSNLYNPEINNYKFLGWYDENGVEYKKIPVGTTGDIVLNAYYTSLRNLAVSKTDENPIIVEDQNNNVVYFTYEIGEIRNIPLNGDNPFWTVQSVAGLSQQASETYTTTMSSSEAKSVSESISDMTVKSNTWTLAETWNNVTTVNESWAESIGKTTEQCKTDATTSSNTLSVTNQNGGSSYHKTEDGSTVYDYNSKTETNDKGHQFDASLSGSYANKMSANLGASKEYGTEGSYSAAVGGTNDYKLSSSSGYVSGSSSSSGSGSAAVSDKDKYSSGIGYENGFEINAGLKYGYHNNTNTVTKTGSDSVSVDSTIDSNTGTWNNSATMSATNQHSSTTSIRNMLSDIITTTKEYGSSYSKGGSDSTTQGFSSTSSNTSGTTSTVTYSKLESKTTTKTYSVDGRIEGKYRCVLAGKAHVFGVAGYDYNTKSFFAYTFSVMDDTTEEFLDYTPKGGNFSDCENSCLPFEIPIDVFNYVNDKTSKTTGIKYRTDSQTGTATITGYTGTDTDVIVPSYVSDGVQAYKVTGIASTAFAEKPVRAVVLGEFIQSIPAGAFKNCTELKSVIGSFTEIGDEAFAGCEKLSDMNIPSNVVKIGEDAFVKVNSITVRAMNSLCAYAEAVKALPNGVNSTDDEIETKRKEITQKFIHSVMESGAFNITINLANIVEGTQLSLTVPTINSIRIDGGSKTYNNFAVKSGATNTEINGMTINNTEGVTLTIDSDNLTLHKVFINGNTAALIMKRDGASLSLIQDSLLKSTANYTVLAKNPVINSLESVDGAIGCLNVTGNFGYVNSIQNEDCIEFTNGTLIKISEEDFNELQNPLSDWVRASEVPSGATIVEQKWIYTQTSYTTSSSSSLSGWELYNTTSAYGDYGSWSEWSTNQAWESDTRQVETRSVWDHNYITGYTLRSYCTKSTSGQRQYRNYSVNGNYSAYGLSSTYGEYAYTPDMGCWADINTINSATQIAPGQYASGISQAGYNKSDQTGYVLLAWPDTELYYIMFLDTPTYTDVYRTEYRYRDRQLIYTYYYKKVENMESDSYPSGDNISNIEQWVRYRTN